MKERLKTPLSGHSTAKFVTGRKSLEIGDKKRKDFLLKKSFVFIPTLILFCLSFIFTASSITIASHNFHGFKKTSAYHRSCLQRYEGIWLGQETWLTERQIPTLNSLGTQFVARSSMEDAISTSILRGRPFGGVSIAWSPSLNGIVTPITNFRHKRAVAVEIDSANFKTLIINVYMPFYDAAKRDECIVETLDTISMIEMMIEAHPLHSIIIGGDFNCELNGNSTFDSYWTDLSSKYDLVSCDTFITDPNAYTYSHDTLGQRKWNDHFFVSA